MCVSGNVKTGSCYFKEGKQTATSPIICADKLLLLPQGALKKIWE